MVCYNSSMYLGIDVGGTKTLLAVFTQDGKLKESLKFETPQNYSRFLDALVENIRKLEVDDFRAACIALPGLIDRDHGVGVRFGNLPWKNVHIVDFLEKVLKAPVLVENDAKLAGLFESRNVKKDMRRVLYITISTGIGIGFIVDGVIDKNTNDLGGAAYPVRKGSRVITLDKYSSGSAIVKAYKKRASDLDSPTAWNEIAHHLAKELVEIIAVLNPDVVVIGGGVGTHFKKYEHFLKDALKKYELPVMKIPPVVQAKRPEEAVIYGCYELLKATYA